MPKLSLTFAAALASLCLAQPSAHAQTDEEAPPAAADQREIVAEEPEPPIPAEQLEAPDNDAGEPTMQPTEGAENSA